MALVYCSGLRAWWSARSQLVTLLSSLVARRWVGLRTLWAQWGFRLEDLHVGGMEGARYFDCCQASRGLSVGFFCSVVQVYLLLSPYICFVFFLCLDL